jgi:hypothetical protein
MEGLMFARMIRLRLNFDEGKGDVKEVAKRCNLVVRAHYAAAKAAWWGR